MAEFINKPNWRTTPTIAPAVSPLLKHQRVSNVQNWKAEFLCNDCDQRWPFDGIGVGAQIDEHTRTEHPETWAIWKLIKQIDGI